LSNTSIRIFSALTALGVMALLLYFWGRDGLAYFCCFVVIIAQIEYAKMTLWSAASRAISVVFVASSSLSMLSAVLKPDFAWGFLSICIIGLFVTMMVRAKEEEDLSILLKLFALASMGVLYCAVLPSMVIKLLYLSNGLAWFFALLAIVFAGDVFAYFIGRKFGKEKLWESISPKKTWAGAYGGLVGSLLAAVLMNHFYFPDQPLILWVSLGLLTGILGQMGDLFESVLKRVAGVKDSGGIMPGHGGFLDRIDGLIFGAPLFYYVASVLSY
jgi:phosphatidate cytidylyltransferase